IIARKTFLCRWRNDGTIRKNVISERYYYLYRPNQFRKNSIPSNIYILWTTFKNRKRGRITSPSDRYIIKAIISIAGEDGEDHSSSFFIIFLDSTYKLEQIEKFIQYKVK